MTDRTPRYDTDGDDTIEADVDNQSVNTDQAVIAASDFGNRAQLARQAQLIRDNAGIPTGETVGLESDVEAGLVSDTADLTDTSRISITSESEAQKAADSGSGTKKDPYVILGKKLDNSENSGSNNGVDISDSDGSYYVKIEDCWIAGYDGNQINAIIGSDGGIEIVDSLIDSGGNDSTRAINHGSGPVTCERVEFGGCDNDGIRAASTDLLRLVNCKFTESQETWSTARAVQTLTTGAEIEMVHCAAEISSLISLLRHNNSATVTIHNCLVNGITNLLESTDGADFDAQSEILYTKAVSTTGTSVDVNAATQGNLEIAYSFFDDNNAGNRLVYFNTDGSNEPSGHRVHHCKFTKTNGSGAGNECLQSRQSHDIEFDHNWVTECTEDAYEHVIADGCSVHHCVADNVTGQPVDIYQGTSGAGSSAKAWIHHIYGESTGDNGVLITDADDCVVHDIYTKQTTATTDNGYGVVIEQRNGSSGATPAGCVVLGPLPLDDVCGNAPFGTIGTPASDNIVAYDGRVPESDFDESAINSRLDAVVNAATAQGEVR